VSFSLYKQQWNIVFNQVILGRARRIFLLHRYTLRLVSPTGNLFGTRAADIIMRKIPHSSKFGRGLRQTGPFPGKFIPGPFPGRLPVGADPGAATMIAPPDDNPPRVRNPGAWAPRGAKRYLDTVAGFQISWRCYFGGGGSHGLEARVTGIEDPCPLSQTPRSTP